MKVTIEGFKIIEGYRLNHGRTFRVDKGFDGRVDLVGNRISKDFYDEHFKPEPDPKPKPNKKSKSADSDKNED